MNKCIYEYKQYGSIETLGKNLGYSQEEILQIAENSHKYYYETKRIQKDDGSFRITYDTRPILKNLHNKIKEIILMNVSYPNYLMGSLPGKDYLANCSKHSGKRIIISEDITKFYDSISAKEIFKMWKSFFHFPPVVAQLLTDLTTYNGFLPQGAIPSSYIANLIFWDLEPELENWLRLQNIVYTRYMDDISISSTKYISKDLQTKIISKIITMLGRKGVRVNRRKHNIATSGQLMQLHKVNINKTPTLPQKKQSEIRSLVKQVEILYEKDGISQEFRSFYNSVFGKINNYSRTNKHKGSKLKERLQKVKPNQK